MTNKLKSIKISQTQKEILETLSGQKIRLKNTFENNQSEINDLLELAKQNSYIYLQRNKLGQKLSLFEENNLFSILVKLQKTLKLKNLPRRVECYDISHLSGTFVYGSMVTFIDGRPAKKFYKLFKCKDQNNDFKNHSEVLRRRLKRYYKWEEDNLQKNQHSKKEVSKFQQNNNPWQLPDLIIVDGGKGQLSSDAKILSEFNLLDQIELIALAKREEEIFVLNNKTDMLDSPKGQQGGFLLSGQAKFLVQRIRDEAHRFAIINQRKAKLKTASKSELDDIQGIGDKTKQKLLQTFGSTQNLVDTLYKNQELVYELVGKKLTEKLKNHFGVIVLPRNSLR